MHEEIQEMNIDVVSLTEACTLSTFSSVRGKSSILSIAVKNNQTVQVTILLGFSQLTIVFIHLYSQAGVGNINRQPSSIATRASYCLIYLTRLSFLPHHLLYLSRT